MKPTHWLNWSAIPVLVLAVGLMASGLWAPTAWAAKPDTGLNGTNRSNIFDNTQNGLQVGIDPIIGYVVQREPNADDPTHIEVRVHLQGAAPNCDYTIELVTVGDNPAGGLDASGHSGAINYIGTMTTNRVGNGSSGAIVVDVSPGAIFGEAATGLVTYAHIDVEDNGILDTAGDCTEADGSTVARNEYGSDPALVKGMNAREVHWLQP